MQEGASIHRDGPWEASQIEELAAEPRAAEVRP